MIDGPAEAAVNAEVSRSASQLAFTGFVVDQAHLLRPNEAAKITGQLDRLRRSTGHQFAVVTVTALGGDDVRSFTTKLANHWGLGRKNLNDGIVLLIAPNERRARIAVGRGLEGELTDLICTRIMDRAIVPQFRRGRIAT